MLRIRGIAASLALLIVCSALPGRAGDLELFEASVGPGSARIIASPASDVLLDVDYSPSSAEGGALFGVSEVRIVATGDLTLTTAGFACPAFSCLYHPLPFTSGTSLLVTAGDDLAGEVAATLDFVDVSVSGMTGYVAVVDGSYLDATGPASEPGSAQQISLAVLAEVPEPHVGLGMTLGGFALLAAARRRAAPTPRETRRRP